MADDPEIESVVESIQRARSDIASQRSVLVAISGIDGSGKGYVTARLVKALSSAGFNAAGINIDGWLNLPHVRFNKSRPAEHFYLHAIRFEEMFSQLVIPLRDHRSVKLEADYAEETATRFRKHLYEFHDLDIVVLEGIYLLKRDFRHIADLAFWVECSFQTALDRVIQRAQEGLSTEDTIEAYQRIYFPAQRIHFQRDDPKTFAKALIHNQTD